MSVTSINNSQAKDFFKENPLAVLSIHGDEFPVAAAVYVIVDDDLNLYFIANANTRKMNALEQSPNVALTLVNKNQLATMQLHGTANVETATIHAFNGQHKEHTELIEDILSIQDHEVHWMEPMFKIEGSHYLVKVTPQWMRLIRFGVDQHSEAEFIQII